MIALSFGAGIQTTAIMVLCANGELPKPDFVVFADTGCEWPETYDYLARHAKPFMEKLGLNFQQVSKGNLYDFYWRYKSIPMPMDRACTDRFKIQPLKHFYKEFGVTEEWIGFSLDEQGRAVRKRERPLIANTKFPLIDLRIARSDCPSIIKEAGLPIPPKSACYFCSFSHPTKISRLAHLHPDLFEKVAALEDRASQRGMVRTIMARPWRELATPQPMLTDDWDYGCGDGYCMR